MTGAMIRVASNGMVELRSDLDILKGVVRWAVRRRREGDGQRSTRREGALPGYEGLGSLLQGEYGRRWTMGDGGNEREEREREAAKGGGVGMAVGLRQRRCSFTRMAASIRGQPLSIGGGGDTWGDKLSGDVCYGTSRATIYRSQ
ncbi:hypothetical protein EDB86DRAFT_2835590 [Lactarius hatsudake]|nr:hypothetical protein EDB86DRAFT_2835590 [Lactarius hatsudake]